MKFEQRDKEMQKCAKNKYTVWCRFLVTFERLDDPIMWYDATKTFQIHNWHTYISLNSDLH